MSFGYHRLGSNVPGKVLTAKMLGDAYAGAESNEPITIRATSPKNEATLLDAEPGPKLDQHGARALGYTGNQCKDCESMRMKIAGHCEVCEECGSSSGCS